MSLVMLSAALALFWLASKQKPKYRKVYLETRSEGAFRTDYSPRVEQYLDSIEQEVNARLAVGPISPVDDLYATLYHPELAINWQRELCGHWLAQRIKETIDLLIYGAAAVLIAEGATRVLTHSGLITFSQKHSFEKLVAIVFSIALLVWLDRRKAAAGETQGYFDGWSDRSKAEFWKKPGFR